MTAGGAVDPVGWLDKVHALLHNWFPRQEGGRAVGKILLGQVNPSGRLPATFERRLQDNPSYANHYPSQESYFSWIHGFLIELSHARARAFAATIVVRSR
jgi:beta-glucosidase